MKKCPGCKMTLSLEMFSMKQTSSDGKQSRCKECRKIYTREWYRNNREKHSKYVAQQRKQIRDGLNKKMLEFLKDKECEICGNNDIRVLEFDHLCPEQKLFNVGDFSAFSWNKVLAEIEKCRIVCANCHAIITGEQRNSYRHQYYISRCPRSESNAHHSG